MNESIYDQVKNRMDKISGVCYKMFAASIYKLAREYPEIDEFDFKTICLEIDRFENEFPTFYKKYLIYILSGYRSAKNILPEYIPQQKEISEVFEGREVEYILERIKLPSKIELFYSEIDDIIEYIENKLNTEIEIQTQEQSKPIATPKGQTQLTREQTALLFFYLRERHLIAQPTNENIAKAISLLSGYSEKQIKDIIKASGTPVCQLGKDSGKVTRNDFKTIISVLEQLITQVKKDYKTNSDNNELR